MSAQFVGIIILNWNGWRDTLACIESLYGLSYPAFEIVVVDNGSTDGSERIIREACPSITLLRNDLNLGFAGGNNIGIAYALAHGADYVWLLNNDTLVEPDSLAPLIECSANTGGLTGSAILRHPETGTVWAAGGSVSDVSPYTLHLFGDSSASDLPDSPFPVDYLPACSLLVPSSLVQTVGPLPEDYFLYFEDTAWCTEAKLKGFSVHCVPGSRIYHRESSSTGLWSSKMHFYFTRGATMFALRYRKGYTWRLAWYLFRHHFANHVGKRRFSAVGPSIRGAFEGLRGSVGASNL